MAVERTDAVCEVVTSFGVATWIFQDKTHKICLRAMQPTAWREGRVTATLSESNFKFEYDYNRTLHQLSQKATNMLNHNELESSSPTTIEVCIAHFVNCISKVNAARGWLTNKHCTTTKCLMAFNTMIHCAGGIISPWGGRDSLENLLECVRSHTSHNKNRDQTKPNQTKPKQTKAKPKSRLCDC